MTSFKKLSGHEKIAALRYKHKETHTHTHKHTHIQNAARWNTGFLFSLNEGNTAKQTILFLMIFIIIVRYLNSFSKIVLILRLFSEYNFILFKNSSASVSSLSQVEKVWLKQDYCEVEKMTMTTTGQTASVWEVRNKININQDK